MADTNSTTWSSLYLLLDPRQEMHNPPRAGDKCYVGFTGRGLRRRFSMHLRDARRGGDRSYRANWIRKILADSLEPVMCEVARLDSRKEAMRSEVAYIAALRRRGVLLVNSTDGGEGVVNPSPGARANMAALALLRRHSDATKAKIGLARRGKKHTPEARVKISAALTGRRQGDEERARRIGRRHTDEAKAKMSAAQVGNKNFLGHKHTDETKARLSALMIGKRNALGHTFTHTDEAKAKMSMARRGKRKPPFSAEWRANMSVAQRAWRARKREEAVAARIWALYNSP